VPGTLGVGGTPLRHIGRLCLAVSECLGPLIESIWFLGTAQGRFGRWRMVKVGVEVNSGEKMSVREMLSYSSYFWGFATALSLVTRTFGIYRSVFEICQRGSVLHWRRGGIFSALIPVVVWGVVSVRMGPKRWDGAKPS
jgi:hypothetical protein